MQCNAYDLEHKVAIVTGASRGIGFATAELLLARGANVVISGRKQEALDSCLDRLSAYGKERVRAVMAHGGDENGIQRLVGTASDTFGHIDILVNNAATSAHYGKIMDAEISAWDKTFNVNVRGVFLLTKAVLKAGMEKTGGSIVNVVSVGGIMPVEGLSIYNVTKAALIHFTKQLALEIGPQGIRVNAVAPGLIKTKFAEVLWSNDESRDAYESSNPLRRIGEPQEIAEAIAFLSSPAASYVNGQVLTVDGGGGFLKGS
ncbi:MAG: SDR family oxidoreductase [Nitratireductor sp.]|nr:SDR family oxidoreductase [Nitratireductor sp.]